MRTFTGTSYEVFSNPSSETIDGLHEELATKEPVEMKQLMIMENPAFDILAKSVEAVGSGVFAVKLSGYFIPPISGIYIVLNERSLFLKRFVFGEQRKFFHITKDLFIFFFFLLSLKFNVAR